MITYTQLGEAVPNPYWTRCRWTWNPGARAGEGVTVMEQHAQTTPRRPVRPTTPADLWRLAEQGRTNGVRLFQELATGAWYATSASRAGGLHYVTGLSCTCEGFVYAGRCQHHSLLLEHLGW